MNDYKGFFDGISKRYSNIEPEALQAVLTPILIPIYKIDKNIIKITGQTHWRASFELELKPEWYHLMQRGVTGKFIPKSYKEGGVWKEICKGRIIDVDYINNKVLGEIYVGSSKSELISSLTNLSENDFLEIDQYGASAKVLSSLSEYYLAKHMMESGYVVRRMPEDTARHLGEYYNYDFEFEKNSQLKKVEVKSLWGTDTRYARLIHSKTKGYETSSCKFETQDIFAVSLFLRTGNIKEFAFARSISNRYKPYGLPESGGFTDYVHQNPECIIGNGSWFGTIEEVWNL